MVSRKYHETVTELANPAFRPAHMRRRRRPIRWVVMVGAAFAAMATVAAMLWPTGSSRVEVVVDHDGVVRTVHLGRSPSVEAALAAAGVQLVSAHILTARSHQRIPGRELAPTVLLDGSMASPDSLLVGRHHHLKVIDADDTIEPVVARAGAAIPAPPMPRVIRKLWHPGLAGVAAQATVGAISGEVVSADVAVQPSPPTPVTDKVVALTFDDGPWPDTSQFLQVLQQAGVKATFCMIGRQVVAHPDWVRAVAAAGMVLCNHTVNHNERLDKAKPEVVQAEVQGGANALFQVLGTAPRLYRPPGGALSVLIEDDAIQQGEQVIGWSVDPSDYKRPGTAKIIATVMAQVRPGGIILLHDGGGDRTQTLAALPQIIARLTAQGYHFTTPDAISPTPAATPAPTVATGEPELPLGPGG
jgi:peptidoglycan-N-acetylglucosamine deacetylase